MTAGLSDHAVFWWNKNFFLGRMKRKGINWRLQKEKIAKIAGEAVFEIWRIKTANKLSFDSHSRNFLALDFNPTTKSFLVVITDIFNESISG